jgi:hypothetical protein
MRRLLATALCLLAAGFVGCTLCPSPYDCDYGFYGGTWERHDRAHGRVGSRFNNAGSSTIVPEEVQTPGEPTPIDDPDRPTIPTPLEPDMLEASIKPVDGSGAPASRRRAR